MTVSDVRITPCLMATERNRRHASETGGPRDDAERLLTVDDVAALLRLTPKGIYSMVSERRIPFVKVSNRLRFIRDDVLAWLHRNRVEPHGVPINEPHPIIECHVDNLDEEIVLFKDYPTSEGLMHKPDAPLIEKHLWPRMQSLAESFPGRMKGTDMRLAEAAFPLGPRTDIYVYVLLKQTGDQYKAVYSIPRIT